MRTATRARAIATIAVLGLFAAACGDDETTPAATTPTTAAEVPATTAAPVADGPKVGLVFDIGGRGDQSFNDAAAAGIERAAAELGITFTEASPNDDGSNRKELLDLAAESSDIVIAVGFLFEADAAAVGIANPDKTFGVIDSAMLDFANGAVPYGDNIAGLVFSEEQGSFLVGAAAALKSTSGQIGFIGGVKGVGGLIERFEAGYIAGAKAVNPDIKIVSEYITEAPDFDGFNAPDRARDIASAMYAGGADIVYHAAGGSGAGLFEAAKATSDESGTKVWAIGVDSDQYNTSDAAVKEFILTSMLKRVDVAVYEIIKAHIEGKVVGGPTAYNLSVDGVGYATSGGFVDDIVADLDAFKAKIISGEIVVPTDPAQA
ncbi:MAG: putative nucleoside ABC transporter nucleoside-binding protein [Acidimicrobiaceae bacterium]|jgi:basic membrane protein A|nr:MAG: putative nucleoside ABC transporter nucleoside-binding protein [Acidimicrobiaceae bacterium]